MNTVLIADDVPVDAQQLGELVQSLGATVTLAYSAIEARQVLTQQAFDLVICAYALTTDETQNPLQFIGDASVAFTLPFGSGVDITVDAMNRGAKHCFGKPLKQQQLTSNIQRLLASAPSATHRLSLIHI